MKLVSVLYLWWIFSLAVPLFGLSLGIRADNAIVYLIFGLVVVVSRRSLYLLLVAIPLLAIFFSGIKASFLEKIYLLDYGYTEGIITFAVSVIITLWLVNRSDEIKDFEGKVLRVLILGGVINSLINLMLYWFDDYELVKFMSGSGGGCAREYLGEISCPTAAQLAAEGRRYVSTFTQVYESGVYFGFLLIVLAHVGLGDLRKSLQKIRVFLEMFTYSVISIGGVLTGSKAFYLGLMLSLPILYFRFVKQPPNKQSGLFIVIMFFIGVMPFQDRYFARLLDAIISLGSYGALDVILGYRWLDGPVMDAVRAVAFGHREPGLFGKVIGNDNGLLESILRFGPTGLLLSLFLPINFLIYSFCAQSLSVYIRFYGLAIALYLVACLSAGPLYSGNKIYMIPILAMLTLILGSRPKHV
jgi:hypothetical protein